MNFLTLEWAIAICETEEGCYHEGIGGVDKEIMDWIWGQYPELKERFSHLVDIYDRKQQCSYSAYLTPQQSAAQSQLQLRDELKPVRLTGPLR